MLSRRVKESQIAVRQIATRRPPFQPEKFRPFRALKDLVAIYTGTAIHIMLNNILYSNGMEMPLDR
jgi:hypothetical protein